MLPVAPASAVALRFRDDAAQAEQIRGHASVALGASAREGAMKSPIVKRSISVAGHKTNISLEEAFWTGLREIAQSRAMTVSAIVSDIDLRRRHANLSSAVRLFVLEHAQMQAAARAQSTSKVENRC
jgi:predicted DNA-binding ribbon-helix-helix protein